MTLIWYHWFVIYENNTCRLSKLKLLSVVQFEEKPCQSTLNPTCNPPFDIRTNTQHHILLSVIHMATKTTHQQVKNQILLNSSWPKAMLGIRVFVGVFAAAVTGICVPTIVCCRKLHIFMGPHMATNLTRMGVMNEQRNWHSLHPSLVAGLFAGRHGGWVIRARSKKARNSAK